MAGEVARRRSFATEQSERRRLLNITNMASTKERRRFSDENKLFKNWNEGSHSSHAKHQQDIKLLQLAVREKEAEIKDYKATLESMTISMEDVQRDCYASLSRRIQQNEDIIAYNLQMTKELYSLREQLKIQQHEHTQMMIVHRINESQLQMKLADITEKSHAALQEKRNKDGAANNVSRRPRPSSHSLGPAVFSPGVWNSSTKPKSLNDLSFVTNRDGSSCGRRSVSGKKSTVADIDTVVTPRAVASRSSTLRYQCLASMGALQELEESPEVPIPLVTAQRNLKSSFVQDDVGFSILKDSEVTVQRKNQDATEMRDAENTFSYANSRSHSEVIVSDVSGSEESKSSVRASQVTDRSEDQDVCVEKEADIQPRIPSVTSLSEGHSGKIVTGQLRQTAGGTSFSEDFFIRGTQSCGMRQYWNFKRCCMETEHQPQTPAMVTSSGGKSSTVLSLTGRPRRKAAEVVVTYKEYSPCDEKNSCKSSLKGRPRQIAADHDKSTAKTLKKPTSSKAYSELIDCEGILACSKVSLTFSSEESTGSIRAGKEVVMKRSDKIGTGWQPETPGAVIVSDSSQSSKNSAKGRPRGDGVRLKHWFPTWRALSEY